ncbi:MAG TPA: hypothetical protein VHG28_05790 [Longimicrobiaceae bacterium]|nr:hypothetical protein [Longimicrobiaceae bacterium]
MSTVFRDATVGPPGADTADPDAGGGGTALGFGVNESTDENLAASFATEQTSSYRVTTQRPSDSLQKTGSSRRARA